MKRPALEYPARPPYGTKVTVLPEAHDGSYQEWLDYNDGSDLIVIVINDGVNS